MNTTTLGRAAQPISRATRAASSSAGPSSARAKSSNKPQKRELPKSTLRSLISLHHASAGFLHAPTELPVGFDNAFRYTRNAPSFRGYYDFASSVSFNQSLHPPGGMENLVEKPRSSEARGMDLKGRTVMPATSVQRTFTKRHEKLWSEGGREQYLSDRELRVQEALYGTWERGGAGMDRVQPGLEGVLDFVEAKGESIQDFAGEWEKRDELAMGAQRTEDGA